MPTPSRLRAGVFLSVVLAAGAFTAGCGGDDDGAAPAEPVTTVDAETIDEVTPTFDPAPTPDPSSPSTDDLTTVPTPDDLESSVTEPPDPGLPADFPAAVLFPDDDDLISVDTTGEGRYTVIVAAPSEPELVFTALVDRYTEAGWTLVERIEGDGVTTGTATFTTDSLQVTFTVEPAEAATAVTYDIIA